MIFLGSSIISTPAEVEEIFANNLDLSFSRDTGELITTTSYLMIYRIYLIINLKLVVKLLGLAVCVATVSGIV
jgi:hypothetical protein